MHSQVACRPISVSSDGLPEVLSQVAADLVGRLFWLQFLIERRGQFGTRHQQGEHAESQVAILKDKG